MALPHFQGQEKNTVNTQNMIRLHLRADSVQLLFFYVLINPTKLLGIHVGAYLTEICVMSYVTCSSFIFMTTVFLAEIT